ncbi:MAG: adenylate/guanylate cyclase domain-containing protein [Magnetococcales bacterium]|nr:adenylate/guanylate cyclase domain-containing protein [Magnetococcales bacterium]
MRYLRTIAPLVAITLFATGVAWLVGRLPVMEMTEQWVSDLRVATLSPAEPQHPQIVIAAITEETLELFPYRSPVDRDFLSNLLQSLENKGAKAMLLDIILDQATEPKKDTKLKLTLKNLTTPIAVSYTDSNQRLTDKQIAFIDEYVPKNLLGFANLEKDPYNNTVRTIFPGKKLEDGKFLPGVVSVLATKLGVSPPKESTLISWRGRPDDEAKSPPFRSFPAHLIPMLPDAWFLDKIVLIGVDLSMTDRHRTPFSVVAHQAKGLERFGTPGIVVHAHVLAQILAGRQSVEMSREAQVALLFVVAIIGLFLAWKPFSTLTLRMIVSFVSLVGFWVLSFWVFYKGGPLVPMVSSTLAFAFSLGAGNHYVSREQRKAGKFIKGAFSRYLSPHVVDILIKNPDKLSLGGEQRQMTAFFSDIAGFSSISEKLTPEELVGLLNEYLTAMCDIIAKHHGTVDKFEGDAIIAFWGAPLNQPNHATLACRAAIDMKKHLASMRVRLKNEGRPELMVRMGLNSGPMVVGNMGSKQRMDYTIMGDAVNLAARLEGANKFYKSDLMISDATYNLAKNDVDVRKLDVVRVIGKKEPVTIYQLLDNKGEVVGNHADLITRFNAGLVDYKKRDYANAANKFQHALEIDKMDGPSQTYFLRCQEYITTPPATDWDGVFQFTAKG